MNLKLILKIIIILTLLTALVSTPILYSVSIQPDKYVKYSSIVYGNEKGEYSYTLILSPNIIYGKQILNDVNKAYRRVVKEINILFKNNLTYTDNGDINITYFTQIFLTSSGHWVKPLYAKKNSFTLKSKNENYYNLTYTLNMSKINNLVKKIEDETGSRSNVYTIKVYTQVIASYLNNNTIYRNIFKPALEITIKRMSDSGDIIEFSRDYINTSLAYEDKITNLNTSKIINSYLWGSLSTISFIGLGSSLLIYSRKYELKIERKRKENILKSLKSYKDIVIDARGEEIEEKIRGKPIIRTHSFNDIVKASDILSQPIIVDREKEKILLYVIGDSAVFVYGDNNDEEER